MKKEKKDTISVDFIYYTIYIYLDVSYVMVKGGKKIRAQKAMEYRRAYYRGISKSEENVPFVQTNLLWALLHNRAVTYLTLRKAKEAEKGDRINAK